MINLNLEKVLEEKEISISDLHKMTGISRSTLTPIVNKPENVKSIKFDILDKICEALNITLEDFLTYESSSQFEVLNVVPINYQVDENTELFLCEFKFTSVLKEIYSSLLVQISTQLEYADYDDIKYFQQDNSLEISEDIAPVKIIIDETNLDTIRQLTPYIDLENLFNPEINNKDLKYISEYLSEPNHTNVLEEFSKDILKKLILNKLINNNVIAFFNFQTKDFLSQQRYVFKVMNVDSNDIEVTLVHSYNNTSTILRRFRRN